MVIRNIRMAYVVWLSVFTFLILSCSYASLPSLNMLDDGSSSPSTRRESNHITDHLPVEKLMVHHPKYKCHQCEQAECDLEATKTCHEALSCYKSSVRVSDGALRLSRGCIQQDDHLRFTCRTSHHPGPTKRQTGQYNVTCCKRDLCNDGEFPSLPPQPDTSIEPLPSQMWKLWTSIVIIVITVPAIAVMTIFLLRRTNRLRLSRVALHKLGADSSYFNTNLYNPPVTSAYYDDNSQNGCGIRAVAAGDSTLREYLECSVSSGSGSGLPLMVQRTLAKQVTLIECVGKGRYGEVWRAQWNADSVAVKIFFSRDEASWRRETEIYSTVMLRHDNILAYIGSDMTSRNSCTQLWLLTHYHPLGSLYEHLSHATLSRRSAMRLLLSAVDGLLHLHTDICGTQGKPAIAHRDIKSKNILVKVNGTCCIADLGLAVTRSHVQGGAFSEQLRQGTKRYMSPEVLQQSMNTTCLESYLKCDVYAFALVMWEVCRRVAPPGGAPLEARAPYHDLAPHDPSFDEMKKIVCIDAARPEIPPHAHPTMVGMASLMRECWHQNASVRLSTLRLKRSLQKLAANDNTINLDEDNEVIFNNRTISGLDISGSV